MICQVQKVFARTWRQQVLAAAKKSHPDGVNPKIFLAKAYLFIYKILILKLFGNIIDFV